jgi:hypothetical protein
VLKNADFTRGPNLAAAVGVVFLIARRSKNWGYLPRLSGKTVGRLANFFALFWGWADYNPKDWSSAPFKTRLW